MKKTDFIKVMKKICFRPRFSLGLSLTEHVLDTFSDNKAISIEIEKPLSVSWTCLLDQSNSALDIYEVTQPLHEISGSFRDS